MLHFMIVLLYIWAQLFKANDVVSSWFLKIYIRVIRKYDEIFCWKNVSSFCSAKAIHIFSAKNIRIFYIESAKTVNEMTLNELVKLTTLWTTGPWIFFVHYGEAYIICLPGKISFKLAGGLFVSSVSLWLAVFTGGAGFTINFNGSLIVAVVILTAPEKQIKYILQLILI